MESQRRYVPATPRVDARLEAALCDALPVLRRFAVRLCDNTDDVYDLLQDTFERAVSQGIPDQVRSTRGWLRRIMFHLFIDGRRAAARFAHVEALEDRHGAVGEAEPEAPEPAWAALTLADIHGALDEIEPVYRDVYSLRMFEYLSYEEIAERLSIERITVGTRLSRARKRLREVLVRRFGLDVTAPADQAGPRAGGDGRVDDRHRICSALSSLQPALADRGDPRCRGSGR
jgi:RNA polymerase sigma-70 factor (ECF subfamily)